MFKLIKVKSLLVIAVSVFLSACVVPEPIQQVTAVSAVKKEELLRERLSKFNRAVYWGASSELASYLSGDLRPKFMREQIQKRAGERIVSSDVVDMNMSDDKGSAQVTLQTKYFQQPTYVVKTRVETQTWKFDRFGQGWILNDLTVEDLIEESPKARLKQ